MESISLYSEARNEYIKQMSTWVVPQLVEFFRREYDRIALSEGKRTMSAFQNWCSEVPRWNQDVIDTNVNELLDNCKCDYIEDLMTAVFIAHTKMLTAIRVNSRQKKLQITLPKLDHFLHRVFVECARSFWKAPFLFSDEVSPIDRQKNVLQAEAMCVEALSGAVRSLLPVKNILRDNLLEAEEEEEIVEEKPRRKHRKHRKRYESSSSESSDSSSSDEEDEKRRVPAVGGASKELVEIESPIEAAAAAAAPAVPVALATPAAPAAPVAPAEVSAAVPTASATPAEVSAAPATPATPAALVVSKEVDDLPIDDIADPIPEFTKPVSVLKEPTPVQLIKDEAVAAAAPATAADVIIDTEPTVKFSPYEMVYDETTPNISEMRYAPKMSIEEMPDKPPYEPIYASQEEDEDDYENRPLPKIQFNSTETALSGVDIDEIADAVISTDDVEDAPMELSDADFQTL